jgi:2-polyprenyl-6-methoxyphenol hydroxylase-like FAD-dependent oxidoreductase
MYPIGSNGASQAILDADALGEAVRINPSVELALQAYEDIRLAPTANIVHSNRQNGPERVMQIVEERAPEGFSHLHDIITQQELEEIANSYKQIAGFDRKSLNAKTGVV